MKRWLPVLVLFAGLGSSFSFTQNPPPADPFGKYLAGIKENRKETALVRIAAECGIDTMVAVPRYAQRPGERWTLVKDLSKAREDQETDFYGTIAVWHLADRILIERWGMELDTGDYYRMLFCLQDHKVRFAEAVDWSISVEGERATSASWGYEQRWKVGQDGKYENVLHRFVDIGEHPIAQPKLDAETTRGLDWNPKVLSWKDMDLPIELLR
jgi:hypothetical protein